jgi:hypothetical protein
MNLSYERKYFTEYDMRIIQFGFVNCAGVTPFSTGNKSAF